MRVLVEQSLDAIQTWFDNLGVEMGVHRVMGGEPRSDDDWRLHPVRDAVFVGTVDMNLKKTDVVRVAFGRRLHCHCGGRVQSDPGLAGSV
jgi:hypothetical protein